MILKDVLDISQPNQFVELLYDGTCYFGTIQDIPRNIYNYQISHLAIGDGPYTKEVNTLILQIETDEPIDIILNADEACDILDLDYLELENLIFEFHLLIFSNGQYQITEIVRLPFFIIAYPILVLVNLIKVIWSGGLKLFKLPVRQIYQRLFTQTDEEYKRLLNYNC